MTLIEILGRRVLSAASKPTLDLAEMPLPGTAYDMSEERSLNRSGDHATTEQKCIDFTNRTVVDSDRDAHQPIIPITIDNSGG